MANENLNEEELDRKLEHAEEGFLGDALVDSKTTSNINNNPPFKQRPPLRRYRDSKDFDIELAVNSKNQDISAPVNDPIVVSKPISLRDILQNPYEDEAETAIIKAIESRVHDHEGSHIFPQIPEESERLFDKPNLDVTTSPIPLASVDGNNLETKRRTISMGDVSLTSFRSIKTNQSNILPSQPNVQKARVDTLSDMAEQMRIMQMRTLASPNENGFLARAAKNVPQPEEGRGPSVGGVALRVELTMNDKSTAATTAAIQSPPPPGFEAKSTDSLYKHAEHIYASATQEKIPHSILRNRLRTESTAGAKITEDDKNTQDVDLTAEDSASPKSSETKADDDPEAKRKKKKEKRSTFRQSVFCSIQNTRQKVILEWEFLAPMFKTDFSDVQTYVKRVIILFVIVLIISAILFYGFMNPVEPHTMASYSWWLLFLLIRQVITFTLAKVTQYLIIDVIATKTFVVRRYLGPAITLFIIQSKGWPFLLITWSAWDFLLLFGDRKFCDHWFYQQQRIKLFNDSNPSGDILTSKLYANILLCGIVGGFLGALKKVWVAWFLGRKKYENYRKDAEKLMKRMLLLSDVAQLSREIYFAAKQEDMKQSLMDSNAYTHALEFVNQNVIKKDPEEEGDKDDKTDDEEDDDDDEDSKDVDKDNLKKEKQDGAQVEGVDAEDVKQNESGGDLRKRSGSNTDLSEAAKTLNSMKTLTEHFQLIHSDKSKLYEMIGEWEEPISNNDMTNNITISDVLQFRQAVASMNTDYPFSPLFGPAQTRNQCVESASDVYKNLMLLTPEKHKLQFETISLSALHEDGTMDEKKAKLLIKVFRPDRDGELSLIDWVKSVDKIYKNIRIFRAALQNSAQIDQAFNTIIDVGFFFVLFLVVLQILSLNPLQVFLTLSGVFLSFAFMFGNAASSYFNGILYVLVQRPYDIGDKISFSCLTDENASTGSPGWFVEGITLFKTTIRYGATNEVATFANGALQGCKVINCRRSPKAYTFILIKFGVDVPYEKIMLFKSAIESFVKARPREWLSFVAFRATRVEYDAAYVEYITVLQHVEGWQHIGPILSSKADLSSFSHELAKKLNMRYEAAPLPVNLSLLAGKREEDATAISQTFSDLSNPRIDTSQTLSDTSTAKIDSNIQQEVLKWSTAFSDTLISNKKKKKKK